MDFIYSIIGDILSFGDLMRLKTEPIHEWIGNIQDEVTAVRAGLSVRQAEELLSEYDLSLNEALNFLGISSSSFFMKKKTKAKLNAEMTEKFLRLASVLKLAEKVLESRTEAVTWLRQEIPTLRGQRPFDLLDTEPGHRLVEQTLLQIQFGIYS